MRPAGGAGVLVVDDLVDTGATAKLVRELLPRAHFATVYAKPLGRPLVDTFVTEVSQDTWIYFPWDLGLAYTAPIGRGGSLIVLPSAGLLAMAWDVRAWRNGRRNGLKIRWAMPVRVRVPSARTSTQIRDCVSG